MSTGSKIRYFFILFISFLNLISCNREENDVVPDVYVNFTIDIRDFSNLSYPTGSDTVDRFDLRVLLGRATAGGYSESGIIIYCHYDGYYAMDMTCPHDFAVNKKVVRIKLDGIYATCPSCQTVYHLPANGVPSTGPGKYYLKNYKTDFRDFPFLIVWNNY